MGTGIVMLQRLLTMWTCTVLFGALALADGAPDLNGSIWHPANPPHNLMSAATERPVLLPGVASRSEADKDGTRHCLPPGLPRLLTQRMAFEFLQRDKRIFIAYQWNRLVRVVDMNVPQGEVFGPQFLGQSVGRWDRDTLVIDSIGFNDSTWLDDAGVPVSDALHVTERYRLARDGRRLQLLLTIEDPQVFARPWQARLEFAREAGGRLAEDVCVERQGLRFWKPEQP